jgi:malonyl-CoA decarboxylase
LFARLSILNNLSVSNSFCIYLFIHQRLRSEFPSLDTFVTLSPLSNFRHWLEDKIHQNENHGKFYDGSLLSDDDLQQLQQQSGGVLGTTNNDDDDDDDPWTALRTVLENYHLENEKNQHSSSNHREEEDSSQHNSIRPILMKFASRYLVLEKHRGKPLDGVARFHVGNGAEVHRVNFGADPSRKGMQNSFGMMVNYRYDTEQVEANIKGFEMDYYRTPASPDVRKWLPVVTTDDTSSTSSKPRSKL